MSELNSRSRRSALPGNYIREDLPLTLLNQRSFIRLFKPTTFIDPIYPAPTLPAPNRYGEPIPTKRSLHFAGIMHHTGDAPHERSLYYRLPPLPDQRLPNDGMFVLFPPLEIFKSTWDRTGQYKIDVPEEHYRSTPNLQDLTVDPDLQDYFTFFQY